MFIIIIDLMWKRNVAINYVIILSWTWTVIIVWVECPINYWNIYSFVFLISPINLLFFCLSIYRVVRNYSVLVVFFSPDKQSTLPTIQILVWWNGVRQIPLEICVTTELLNFMSAMITRSHRMIIGSIHRLVGIPQHQIAKTAENARIVSMIRCE